MAYLPPHKRHSGGSSSDPAPPTSALRSLSVSSSPRGRHHQLRPPSYKIIHAAGCVSRWSPLPRFSPESLDDAESFRLEPFACDPVERNTGAKPLVLSLSSPNSSLGSPKAAPAAIAERFLPQLLSAAERARAGVHDYPNDVVKPSLVARVGKVLFQTGGSPVSLDSLREAAKAGEEGSMSQVRRLFYTNVPRECLEEMEQSAVQLMGLEFDSIKEHYHVKISDKQQSDSTMSCKCSVQEDGKLAIHKVELNQIRQLVEDISCLSKDLDLRLMFSTKRILKTLDPEVENAIHSLVSSAILDPNVKGGLRWPLGKVSIGERFCIVGVWHIKYKAFRNKTSRLFLRHADRFDHRSSTGEVSDEVTFKLTGILNRLKDDNQEEDTVREMLESVVRTIWDSALRDIV